MPDRGVLLTDVGGLLHEGFLRGMMADIAAEVGCATARATEAFNQHVGAHNTGKINEAALLSRLASTLGYQRAIPSEVLVQYARSHLKVNEDVIEVLRQIDRTKWRVVAVSSAIPAHTRFLDSIGLYDVVDARYFSYSIGVAKPNPAFFLEVARRENLSEFHKVHFIDDSLDAVLSAAGLGIDAIHFRPEIGADSLGRLTKRLIKGSR